MRQPVMHEQKSVESERNSGTVEGKSEASDDNGRSPAACGVSSMRPSVTYERKSVTSERKSVTSEQKSEASDNSSDAQQDVGEASDR